MEPIWHLDEPSLLSDPQDKNVLRVKGWIASIEKVENIRIVEDIPVSLTLYKRPNLEKALEFKGLWHIGFLGECPFDDAGHLNHVTVAFDYRGKCFEIIAPVTNEKRADRY